MSVILRNLDNWSVYRDNEGQPLLGRLTFFALHTTDKVNIYAEDGTPLSNPMHTGANGKTEQQVFLQNEDVTVLVEKYIGQANMSDDEDNLSAWVEQFTFDVLKNQYVPEEEVVPLVNVPNAANMTALRQLDASEISYVKLLGYYTQGDMPPVHYKKVSDATLHEDGGSVIQVAGTTDEYWVLIPYHVLDCRVFGVFPSEDDNNITSYNSQLRWCFEYANAHGLDVYMPQVYENNGYYYLEGSNHTLQARLIIDDGVRLYGKPGTSSTLTCDQIDFFGDVALFYGGGAYGFITVNCPTVRSSWAGPEWTAWQGTIKNMLIDKFNNTTFHVMNCKAEIVKDISDMTLRFTNCEVTGGRKIYTSNVQFFSCGFVTDHQIGETSTVSELHDNKILLVNVKDANTYILWKNLQGETDYGDLMGQSITAALLPGTINISNFNGTIYLSNNDATVLNVSKFTGNLIFPDPAPATLPSVFCTDSAIYMGGTTPAVIGIIARRCNFAGNPLGVWGTAFFEQCTIDNAIGVQGDLTVKYCTINANIAQHNAATINLIFTGNTVNATLNLAGDTANTVINATISNNIGNSQVPIGLDRTNLDPIDSHHTYTYSGNSGTFLPYVTKPVVHEYTIKHRVITGGGTLSPSTEPYELSQQVLGGSDDDENGTPSGYIFPWYYQPLFDQVQMFRIGIDRFQINAKLTTWPEQLELAGTHDEYKYNKYHDAQLGAYFIDGYTFGIMPYWPDPEHPTMTTAMPNTPNFFKGSLSFSFNNMPSFTDYHMHMAISYECMDKHD